MSTTIVQIAKKGTHKSLKLNKQTEVSNAVICELNEVTNRVEVWTKILTLAVMCIGNVHNKTV